MPLIPDVSARRREPELMDRPDLDPGEHLRALAGLARINRFTDSAGLFWGPIAALARKTPDRPVRVLDVATGSGDVPVALWNRGRRAGVPVEVAGCDISPTAITAGTERAVSAGADVRFFAHDAVADPLPAGYDVVISSLFLHHLDLPDAVRLLAHMGRAAGSLVLVNDLDRGYMNHVLVWLACRLLTRSPVVHADGPASVRSAFTPGELTALAGEAGLTGATVARKFPCRMLLTWRKPE